MSSNASAIQMQIFLYIYDMAPASLHNNHIGLFLLCLFATNVDYGADNTRVFSLLEWQLYLLSIFGQSEICILCKHGSPQT